MDQKENTLTCALTVVRSRGEKRLDGSIISWHERCGRPANRITLKGDLTEAEAVLCYQHQVAAEAETRRHQKGKKAKPVDPRQTSFI